jgi:di/tricarboxylate transporter
MKTITVKELMLPLGSAMLLLYMATLFSKKIKTRDLTPGLQHIKEETRRMGKMKYPEYVTAGTLFLIVALWIFGAKPRDWADRRCWPWSYRFCSRPSNLNRSLSVYPLTPGLCTAGR